jgi:hypothetical protein
MAKTRRRPRLTDDEREQRRAKEREQFEAAVNALLDSDGWERWVRTRAAFRRYSFRNTILIAQQMPTATRVAGFRAWLKLNRCVRKGEQAIRIFAPCPVIDRDRDTGKPKLDGDGQPKKKLLFRLTAVFDVSQTDQLPDTEVVPLGPPPGAPITGDSHAALFAPLVALAHEVGYALERRDLSGHAAAGWCDLKARLIVIGEGEPNAELRTLVHELFHAKLSVLENVPTFRYAEEEVIVDTATYLACLALGLDVSCESIGYVAGWGESGELEQIQKAAETIDALARWVEDAAAAAVPSDDLEPVAA